jgi:hypothetical protein
LRRGEGNKVRKNLPSDLLCSQALSKALLKPSVAESDFLT